MDALTSLNIIRKPTGPNAGIHGLAEDAYGNLWGATGGSGILRIEDSGFVSYDSKDGLGTARVATVFEDHSGRLCVQTSWGNPLVF